MSEAGERYSPEDDPDDDFKFPARYRAKGVANALGILGAFTPERQLLGLSEIARLLGLSRSAVHRYASTLVILGFLEQDPSRKYRLTLRVTTLGMSATSSMPLEEHCRPFVGDLCKLSGYTVSVTVLDGPEVLYIERAQGSMRQPAPGVQGLGPGSRVSAHCTASGKVLLAFLPDDEREHAITELRLHSSGPNAITSRAVLRAALDRVRADGFALNDEELAANTVAIAVPIRNENREVAAAISIAAPWTETSLDGLIDEFLTPLLGTAREISARLGFRDKRER